MDRGAGILPAADFARLIHSAYIIPAGDADPIRFSHAFHMRGGWIGSDVDLLVEFQPGSNIGLFEMGALKEDLEERLGCQVDLLSRRAVERSRNPIRRAAILAHHIPIYAR